MRKGNVRSGTPALIRAVPWGRARVVEDCARGPFVFFGKGRRISGQDYTLDVPLWEWRGFAH